MIADLFENIIICKDCNKKTKQISVNKEGFNLRALQCTNCNKIWYHPEDMLEYRKFNKIRSKKYRIKLRMVGNSFCVSIPREIIQFQQLERELDKMLDMALEEPGKLTIFFRRLRGF